MQVYLPLFIICKQISMSKVTCLG